MPADVSDSHPMSPSRPYIMRALYQWIVDNDCTPYVLVDAHLPDVSVPEQYVKDGQIVLNISPTAGMDLDISNDAMAFKCVAAQGGSRAMVTGKDSRRSG